jgi:putative nucleotidyltransferase with HDIG domain
MLERRTTPVALAEAAMLAAAVTVAVITSRAEDWEPWQLPLILLTLAVVSDLFAIETRRIRISATHFSIVVAMALLGPAPAVAIGIGSTLADALRSRPPRLFLLLDLATYSAYPLIGALALRGVENATGLDLHDPAFLLVVFAAFLLTSFLNFALIVGAHSVLDGESFWHRARTVYLPLIPAEMAVGLLAVGVIGVYESVGLMALGLCTIVVFTFQYLLRELLTSQHRAEALEERGRQLASLQLGTISALMHTLDLRDRMTARHCAAVARYSRQIARELGLAEADQELVHTAGLLHDIGKFVFPDHILKADVPLTERDWQIIRMHPFQGAKIVAQVEGYGPISAIVLAHHERWDGAGYPDGLRGQQIPIGARIVLVVDAFHAMTSDRPYRTAMGEEAAIRELHAAAGSQLCPSTVRAALRVIDGARTAA